MPVLSWPDGEFDPCPLEQSCENCGHPMRGHFRENKRGYATRCGACWCEHWCCRHSGMRVLIPVEKL